MRLEVEDQDPQRLLFTPFLLTTESAAEFRSFQTALALQMKPRGMIEQMYVADIANLSWDVLRLRRCKAAIINAACQRALQTLLHQILPASGPIGRVGQVETLANNWFTDAAARREVSALLKSRNLDESAIEAEAYRRSFKDLETLERMLTLLEVRRTKALAFIAEYRGDLAARLRQGADRVIESADVLRLEDASAKKSAA